MENDVFEINFCRLLYLIGLSLLILLFNNPADAQKSSLNSDALSGQWTMHVIDNFSFGADGTRLGDADNDGLLDIVTGWEQGHMARLYFNPGANKAVRPWPYIQVPVSGIEDAFLADLDEDGFKDLITLSEDTTKQITFFWAPNDFATYKKSSYWKSDFLPVSEGKKWMFGVPMDVDQKNGIDLIVGAKGRHGTIGWLESPQDSRNVSQWKYHEISKAGWIMSILKTDMNADGRKDILISDRYSKNGNIRGCGGWRIPAGVPL